MYSLARPLLFALDAERAHELTLRNLERAHTFGLTRLLASRVKDRPVEVMGLRFPNRVGLSAGLDKNAAHIDALGALGFGFVELGTVTPQPQPGNSQPRLFRLPRAQALINRFGFNNEGVVRFVANVSASTRFWEGGGIVGLNIGKNAVTPVQNALDDYKHCLEAVYPLLVQRPGYVAVNISSPNTKNLRDLQTQSELQNLLGGLAEQRKQLEDRYGKRVPMAIKIAPDLSNEELPRVADVVVAQAMDAIIATNTTISRTAVADLPGSQETGGLSGSPLRERATEVISLLKAHLGATLPIIGVGGILSGPDAVEKVRAGASLVQLYTGLIYRGPGLIAECRRAIEEFEAELPS